MVLNGQLPGLSGWSRRLEGTGFDVRAAGFPVAVICLGMRSWVVLEVEGLVITFFLLPHKSSFWFAPQGGDAL